MHIPSPRKKLPVNPSLEHLQKQAKRRVKQNPSLQLTAAQHQLAQEEYGCKTWAELALMIASMTHRQDPALAPGERYAPLPKAARARDFEQVRRLLEAGAYTPNNLDQALAHVLWYGDAATWPARKAAADLLLDYGADPDGQYGSGGYGPIVFGTGECVQPEGLLYLIEAGADVSIPPLRTKYGNSARSPTSSGPTAAVPTTASIATSRFFSRTNRSFRPKSRRPCSRFTAATRDCSANSSSASPRCSPGAGRMR